jgi:hypothetical protein
MPFVALLSDFGSKGPYVGLMKAEVVRRAKDACLIDITHEVSPFCILEGAFLLMHAMEYFPQGTVFLAVVDPGVGTSRPALVLKANKKTFIGPDNGLFAGVAQKAGLEALYEIDLEKLKAHGPIFSTFHGRDVFARAAGLLLAGDDSFLTPRKAPLKPLPELFWMETEVGMAGKIAHIDRFGNLVTTIPWTSSEEQGRSSAWVVRMGGHTITQKVETYQQGNGSFPFFLESSFGTLEVAMRERSAKDFLGAGLGEEVTLASA